MATGFGDLVLIDDLNKNLISWDVRQTAVKWGASEK